MWFIIVTLQIFLLLPALLLVLLSRRASRGQRSRHGSYVAAASLLGLLAAIGALISLSLVLAGDEPVDAMLSFAPPVATLLAVALVLRRGLSAPERRRRPA